jgi:hypothetical protein
VPADLDPALAAVELVLGVTALEPVFGIAASQLAAPRVRATDHKQRPSGRRLSEAFMVAPAIR